MTIIKRSVVVWMVWLAIMYATPPAAGDSAINREIAPSEIPVRQLAEFEAVAVQSPEVLAAAAALEENFYTQTHLEAQSGWRFFGGTDIGRYREQVDDDYLRTYERLNVRAGLMYPLLGARTKEREQLARAHWDVRSTEHENDLALRQSLLALRLHYINYWSAQEKIKMAEAFLGYQPEMAHVLRERTVTGHLRDSDRRELLSAFASARRDLVRAGAVRRRALGALQFIAGGGPDPFQAGYPVMATPCTDPGALEIVIRRQHPRMRMAADAMEAQKTMLAFADKTQAGGNISFFTNLSSEFTSSEPEYGVGVNLSFDIPLHVRQATSAKRLAAQASFERAQQEAEAIRQELVGQARETLGQFLSAEESITFAVQRLAAMREAVRENLLRYAYLTGDVVENLHKSRYEYYKAASDCIDAFALRLQQQAHLLSLVPDTADACRAETSFEGGGTDNTVGPMPWSPGEKETPSAWGESLASRQAKDVATVQSDLFFTVYVWDSARLLHQFETLPGLFDRLRGKYIDRLLVSYTAAQIDALETSDYVKRWRQLIMTAQRRGFQVELLLGEPLWILPDYRTALLEVIRKLSVLPFHGIHLDLEPNQLMHMEKDEAYLLDQLLASVKAVRETSPLALGLSIHHRYLDPSRPDEGLGKALQTIGVDEVTAMIYNANPDRVARMAAPILHSFPALHLSIAQSVEPILSSKESHAARPVGEFRDAMRRLRSELVYPNFQAIVIQSWADYEKMQP